MLSSCISRQTTAVCLSDRLLTQVLNKKYYIDVSIRGKLSLMSALLLNMIMSIVGMLCLLWHTKSFIKQGRWGSYDRCRLQLIAGTKEHKADARLPKKQKSSKPVTGNICRQLGTVSTVSLSKPPDAAPTSARALAQTLSNDHRPSEGNQITLVTMGNNANPAQDLSHDRQLPRQELCEEVKYCWTSPLKMRSFTDCILVGIHCKSITNNSPKNSTSQHCNHICKPLGLDQHRTRGWV